MASKNARRFHPKLISLAVASCFAVSTAYAQQAVLPTGANPISGISSVITNGNTMDVTTNLNRSLIQWNTFSIGQGATVNFNQPSSISAVLNRVMGGVPSEILGAMNSNGRVVLINTSGITFGATAQINLPGLVASTLNLSDSDFLANRLRFTDGAGAGSVINNANFHTAPGGEVYLVGKSVTNNGTITTPQGEVILAAGNSVELVSPGTPNLRVEVTAPDNQAVNLGTIVADAGRVGIYAGLVRQGGTIRADGVQMTDDGRIVLKATKNSTVDAGSVTSASGPKGGTVEIHSGDTTLVYGDVSATGSAGKGGTVSVLGNLVGVLGDATIDASGATGGGTVLVGGDFQGKNPAIPNAYRTVFGPDATIKADATVNGDGGKVIVWSDDATRAFGTISARGGAEGGDGGFVEVSGKRWLDFHASVDTRAPKGKTGTLLLDPQDVQIVSGSAICCGGAEGSFFGGGGEGPSFWEPNGNNSTSTVTWGDTESPGTIINNLQFNDVIITTSSGGNMGGDITVVHGATYNSNNALTLLADRHIVVDAVNIINDGNGDINLLAGGSIGIGTCVVCVGPANIETGGNLLLSAGGNINIVGSSLRAGYSHSGRDSFLTVSAGGSVNVNNSSLSAVGGDNGSGNGFSGGILISGASVGILNSNLSANGGQGHTGGGHGQVVVNSFGSLTVGDSEGFVSINASGGNANCCGGPEGSSGGLATIFLNAAGALAVSRGVFLAAEGGDSSNGPGGGAQISLFGGSVYFGGSIHSHGGQGSNSWSGGGGAANIFGGSVLIDGPEGSIEALGGFGGMRGGDAAVTISSGSTLTLQNNSFVGAFAGDSFVGDTGGNASVGMSALNDIQILDSHVEAEGLRLGSAVVLLNSTLGGVIVDGSGSTLSFPSTVLARTEQGTSEITFRVFDIVNVNHDYVEAASFDGGPASVNLHFTGRSDGGWFVNGVETPDPPGFFPSSPVAQSGPQGFFVNGSPAVPGSNFFVTYSGALPDPCLLAPEICAPPRLEPPNINEASEQVGTGGDKKKKDEPVCRG